MFNYQTYKPSRIKWIGEIPFHWEIWKIKFTSYVKGRIGWDGLRSEEFFENEYAYLVTGTDFINGLVNWETCYQITKDRYSQDKHIQLKEEDLLITKDGTIGKTAVVKKLNGYASLNSGVFVVRPLRKYRSNYLYYILNSDVFKQFINITTTGTTILHLYQNIFEIFEFPIPTINEQLSIIHFLDFKTNQIDTLIANRQKQIELLFEQKTTIINKAVTQGIEPNFKMKPSGIEWLPEVPITWNVWKMKFLTRIETGNKNTDDAEENGEYPFFVRSDKVERLSTYSFDGEAILTAGDGVGVAKVFHYANCKMAIHQRVYKIFHFKKILGEFLYFYLRDNFYKEVIKLSAKTTVDSLRMPMLANFPVAYPTIDEQKEILSFIKIESTTIDNLITKYQKQIDLMQEYRTSLISQAVTGKIDVRDWKPRMKN